MMTHLDDSLLNEYLDGMLDAAAQAAAETHLAECAGCRAALAELQTLFLALDEVAEVALTTDLTARVTAELSPDAPFWLRPFLLIQLAAGIGMAVWLWPVVRGWLRMGETAVRAAMTALQPIQFNLWERVLEWETAVLQQSQLARPAFNLAAGQWAWLVGLALVVWLAGNRLLLSREQLGMRNEE